MHRAADETAGDAPGVGGRQVAGRELHAAGAAGRGHVGSAVTNTMASGGRASAARREAAAASVAPPAVRSRAWSATDEPDEAIAAARMPKSGSAEHRGVSDGVHPGQWPHAGGLTRTARRPQRRARAAIP